MKIIEEYTNDNGYTFTLEHNETKWQVSSFDENGEWHWTVTQLNGIPFTEEQARHEYNRWR